LALKLAALRLRNAGNQAAAEENQLKEEYMKITMTDRKRE